MSRRSETKIRTSYGLVARSIPSFVCARARSPALQWDGMEVTYGLHRAEERCRKGVQ